MNIDAIVINGEDNVATALRDIQPEEKVVVTTCDGRIEFQVREYIPYGHKFAIKNIPQGENIIKYGETIGRATQGISSGRHAHIQNIESLRGRGDLEPGK